MNDWNGRCPLCQELNQSELAVYCEMRPPRTDNPDELIVYDYRCSHGHVWVTRGGELETKPQCTGTLYRTGSVQPIRCPSPAVDGKHCEVHRDG